MPQWGNAENWIGWVCFTWPIVFMICLAAESVAKNLRNKKDDT